MILLNKIKKLLISDKNAKYILAIGIIGIVLILISGWNFSSKSNSDDSINDFAESTEKRLSKIVCRITGEKDVAVMVSLESNGETIYADAKTISKNNKTDSQATGKYKSEQTDDSQQSYIIIENAQGGEEALVISKINPTVMGVVVVTQYANNSAVAERITDAVATALNISEKRVCVVLSK